MQNFHYTLNELIIGILLIISTSEPKKTSGIIRFSESLLLILNEDEKCESKELTQVCG